ncbi:MAG: ABC transporter permease [Candidatus Saccharimonadales bacterium]
MISALKAEFKKLLTVRSTYYISFIVLIFVIFIAFYVTGWRLNPSELRDPTQLAGDVTGALNVTVFGAIVAILLMTHEYRYNTITYTLTSSNSRSKVLWAKFIVVSVYALIFAAVVALLSPIMTSLGVHAAGHTLAPQVLHYSNLAWRSLFYGWGYGMAGLLLAVLLRNQVASIVGLFVIHGVVEQLLSLLLKHNTVYLPFTSLEQVIGNSDPRIGSISPARGALVFTVYVVVGWAVAWYLFLHRDATKLDS